MGARDKTAFAMVARIRAIVHTSFSLSTLFSRRALALCRRRLGMLPNLKLTKQHGASTAKHLSWRRSVAEQQQPGWVSPSPRPPQARSMLPGVPGASLPHGKPPVRFAPGSRLWLAAVALARTQTPAMDKRNRFKGIAQRPQARLGPRPHDGLARTTGQCHFQAAHPRPPTLACAHPAPAARSFS